MMTAGSLDADSVYGYCSQCQAPIVSRTRGIPCQDTCARGHRHLAIRTLKQRQTSYVCGFMFDPDRGVVVLVEKDRPAWQAGKLNGVGGKVESVDVNVKAAMVREFHEEAGVLTHPEDWSEFATLVGPDYKVHMLRAFSDRWRDVRPMESEKVTWYPVNAILAGSYQCVDRMAFLLPLALHRGSLAPVVFEDSQPDEAKVA